MTNEDLKRIAVEKKIVLPPFPAKYLTSISKELSDEEGVLFFCQAKEGKIDGTFFVSKKRVGFIKLGFFSGTSAVSVDINRINSIAKRKGVLSGEIEIWDNAAKIVYSMSSLHVDMAENAIKEAKTLLEQKNNVSINQTSAADEILKFKNLLDQGIITQDEFDKKKIELLGL